MGPTIMVGGGGGERESILVNAGWLDQKGLRLIDAMRVGGVSFSF